MSDLAYCKSIYIICSVLYILDIFLVLNTSYYEKGIEIRSRLFILRNYRDNYLVIDFISLFYFILMILGIDVSFYLILFDLFRIVKLSKCIGNFGEIFNTGELKNGYFQIVLIFCRVVLLAHVMACINHFICSIEIKNNIK